MMTIPEAYERIVAGVSGMSKRGAWISKDGLYRYALWRFWDPSCVSLPILMLNPSTADAEADDPTIRRCIGFATREGFGGIMVVNLFAYRATNPADLAAVSDPRGPDNEAAVLAATEGRRVLCAYGASMGADKAYFTLQAMRARGAETMCLGVTKDGAPRHPLYVRGDQPMIEFRGAM